MERKKYFEIYIPKLLKNITENNGITFNAKQQLNSSLLYLAQIISKKTIYLTEISQKRTISNKQILNALKLLLTTELYNNVYTFCNNKVENYENSCVRSRRERADIIFPPSIAEHFLRKYKYFITETSSVCLASALEYITTYILANSVNIAIKFKRNRITIRDLELGIRYNSNLDTLFRKNNIMFLGGGVTPFIHSSLIKKNGKKILRDKKSSYKYKPGTVSIRDIKKYQKISNCLFLPKSPFEKLIREITEKRAGSNVKISKDSFGIIQYFMEQYVIDLLRDANFASIHASRLKLLPIDITFAQAFKERIANPHYIT